jgi:hypothetical protein
MSILDSMRAGATYMTEEDLLYTPETLREFAAKVETLRHKMLFDVEDAGADAESEQYFLLAMHALETAQRFLSLAALKQSQAIK